MLRIAGSREITIGAPIERVWSLVSEPAAMARWSPQVRASAWIAPATGPAVGASFRTTVNLPIVRRWTNTSTVYRCEAPVLFEFGVGDDPADPTTVWTFELRSDGTGTVLVERWHMRREYRVVRAYFRLVRQRHRLESGVDETLQRIKRAAETSDAN